MHHGTVSSLVRRYSYRADPLIPCGKMDRRSDRIETIKTWDRLLSGRQRFSRWQDYRLTKWPLLQNFASWPIRKWPDHQYMCINKFFEICAAFSQGLLSHLTAANWVVCGTRAVLPQQICNFPYISRRVIANVWIIPQSVESNPFISHGLIYFLERQWGVWSCRDMI